MTALEVALPEVEHGTRSGYRGNSTTPGCRCCGCTAANTSYSAQRRREPQKLVPIGQVRTRIGELLADGHSLSEIARLCGVGRPVLQDILDGKTRRCTRKTRRQVLGVITRQESYISVIPDLDLDERDDCYDDALAGLRLLFDPEMLLWRREGACAHLDMEVITRQEMFFARRGASRDIARALEVCGPCPVWRECLGFALATDETEGIWGRAAGSHRRKIVHHGITVDELGIAGMDDDPTLGVLEAVERVLAARAEAAS